MMKGMVAGAVLLALTGCSVARMQGFDAMAAATDTVAVSGIGGGERGAFRLSTGAEGHFSRRLVTASEEQDRFGHPLGGTERFGEANFTIAGPGIAGTLAGACRTRQAEYRDVSGGRGLQVETVAAVLPLHYDCRFTRDGRPVGGMILGEPRPIGVQLAERRAGAVTVDGRRLNLVSEHRVEGAALGIGVATPLGYRFEEAGRVIGMVSLNGARRFALPRDPAARDAALAAGLALTIFRDPADL